MAAPFPHHYELTITRTARSRASLDAGARPTIAGAPPPEFDGDPAAWSPEHLLLGAIGLCLETTFDALAAREQLDVAAWQATVAGTLDKTKLGLQFTAFSVAVDVTVAAPDVERARAILDRARRACIVSNALRVPVEVDGCVHAASQAA